MSIFSTTGNLLAIGDLTNITYALSPLKPNTTDMRNRNHLRALFAAIAVVTFTAAHAVNYIPILGAFLSDEATFTAEDMKSHITYPYTGEISYDGPNRKIVLNNFVLTDTLKIDFIDITVKYPEGFTIELHGSNYIKGSSATYVIHSKSNMHLIADNDASFTAEGGGIENNGFIQLDNSSSIIFEGGSYTLSPNNSVGTYPLLFSVNSYIPDSIVCDPASVSLSNIPPASLVFRNCNAHFTGKNVAFAACFGYFGMSGCEVTYPDNFFVYNSGVASSPELIVESMVAIDATNFPNANFRNIIAQYDTDGDGYLNKAELTSIASVTSLNVSNKNINSLKGIEYFTGLQYLYCSNNQLTALDVSKNRNLKLLECQNNYITSLDVSGMLSLFRLFCQNNRLTSLNIDNCPALTQLYCYRNRLPFNNMVSVFVALPETTSTTYFYMYDNSNLNEGNKMYDCQALRNAIDRGWTPMQYLNGDWVPFHGITDYSIIVGGVQVTEANMDNITGTGITGSVTYNPYENVLTLSNATITSDDCIRTGSTVHGLKILISGEVNLNATRTGRPAIIFNNLDGDAIQGIAAGDQYAKLNINVPDGNSVTPAIYYISGYGTRCLIKDIDIHMTGNAYIGSENWDEKLTVENSTIISEAPNGEFYVIDDVQLVNCYVALPEGGYFNRGQLCNAQGQDHHGPYQILRSPKRGDINGDGEIDVRDITALIDIIMNSGTNPNADVNNDNDIDVRDITALIDIIMNN